MGDWVDDVHYDHTVGVLDPAVAVENYQNFINAVRALVSTPDPNVFNVSRIQAEFEWLHISLDHGQNAVSLFLGRNDLYVYGMLHLPSNEIWYFNDSPTHWWPHPQPLNQSSAYDKHVLEAGVGFSCMDDAIVQLSKPVVDPRKAATYLKRLALMISEACRFHSVLDRISGSWWSGLPLDKKSLFDVKHWDGLSRRLRDLSVQHDEEVQHDEVIPVDPTLDVIPVILHDLPQLLRKLAVFI